MCASGSSGTSAGLPLPRLLSATWAHGDAGELSLDNDALAATWTVTDGALRAVRLVDKLAGRTLALPPDVFTLAFPDGTVLGSAALRVTGEPRVEQLTENPRAARLAERLGGRQISVELADPAGRLHATRRGILRDGP